MKDKPQNRAPLVWEDPSVPQDLREAYKPLLSEDEMSHLPDSAIIKLRQERQKKIQKSLSDLENRHQIELQKQAAFAEGASRIVEQIGPAAEIGKKVRNGGSMGQALAHGTAEQKAMKAEGYRTKVGEAKTKYPKKTFIRIFAEVGKSSSPPVSARTVSRAWYKKS